MELHVSFIWYQSVQARGHVYQIGFAASRRAGMPTIRQEKQLSQHHPENLDFMNNRRTWNVTFLLRM